MRGDPAHGDAVGAAGAGYDRGTDRATVRFETRDASFLRRRVGALCAVCGANVVAVGGTRSRRGVEPVSVMEVHAAQGRKV